MLGCEIACGAAMPRVVTVDFLNACDGLFERFKAQQPITRRDESLKSSGLHERGPAAREIGGGSIAEPSRMAADVRSLGDPDLGARTHNEITIREQIRSGI